MNSFRLGIAVSALALTTAMFLAGNTAIAQEDGDTVLEEIRVTATKREERLLDVPLALQAFDDVQLQRTAIRELNELINFVPGASEGRTTNAATRQYQVRGVAAFYGDSTVGYYIDEAAYSIPNRNWAPIVPTYDVERVEVLRGPQGTLYGLGSMGGTIRFITKDPDLQDFRFDGRVGYSDTSGGDENSYLDAALSLPLISDRLGVRLAASTEERGGFAQSPTFPGELDQDKIDNYRIKAKWLPTDKSEVTLSYQYIDVDDDWGKQYQWNEQDGAFLPPSTLGGEPVFGGNDTQLDIYSAFVSLDFGSVVFESSTGNIERGGDGGIVPLNIGAPFFPILEVGGEAEIFTQEFRLVSQSEGPWNWIVGGIYQDSKNQEVVLLTVDAPPPVPAPFLRLRDGDTTWDSESWAVFGEVSYEAMEGDLVWTLGLRYFDDDRTFTDINVPAGPIFPPPPLGPPPPQPTVFTSSENFSSTNPRFNVAYYPNESTTYYVNIAKGFRSGTFNTQAAVAASPQAQPFVDPDELWSYEIGGKWNFSDSLLLELAAYYFTWEDQQLNWSAPPNQIQVIANVGETVGYGLDYSLNWRTQIEGLSFAFSGNFNSTEIDSLDNPADFAGTNVIEGEQLASVPEMTFSMQMNLNRPIGRNLTFDTNIGYSYIDEQGDPTWFVKGEDQSLLRARVGVSGEHWGLHAVGTNLLDSDEPIQVSGSGVTLNYPRTVGLEFTLNY